MPMFYRNTSAALLVYDVTNQDSYNAIQHWVAGILSSKTILREFAESKLIFFCIAELRQNTGGKIRKFLVW